MDKGLGMSTTSNAANGAANISTQRRLSIVVPVEETEDALFIAMPFAEEFDGLLNAIEAAAHKLGMRAHRSDRSHSSNDFLRDIETKIRKSRVVLAVCTPETGRGDANPNVMYELGLAHSIGKATVILTTDRDSLPIDIRTKHSLQYDPGQLEELFLLRLGEHLSQAKGRVTNGVTDRSYLEIAIVDGLPLMCQPIVCVLDFAKKVHNGFQVLDTGHLGRLVEDLMVIVNGAPSPERITQQARFNHAWNLYLKDFDGVHQDVWCGGSSDPPSRAVYEALGKMQHTGAQHAASIQKIREFGDRIQSELRLFTQFHGNSVSQSQHNLLELLNRPAASEFLTTLIVLRGHAQVLVAHADSMIVNLINLLQTVSD